MSTRERVDIAEIRGSGAVADQQRAQDRAREQHEQQLRDIGWEK